MRYRLVLFDFDGTLTDSMSLYLRIGDEVREKFALAPVAEADVPSLRSMGTVAALRSLGLPARRLPSVLRFARARLAEERTQISLREGMPALLRTIAATDTVGIVSSNAESTVRAVLGPTLAGAVSEYACGVGLLGKAVTLRRLLRRRRLLPASVVLVGDEERDVAAAAAAGVDSIGVTWGVANASALGNAGAVCRSVEELGALLLCGAGRAANVRSQG